MITVQKPQLHVEVLLMQVLFFIPAVRKAMLSITPDPDKEFSMSCEMSLLFRMLYTARGSVCQASNLFRSAVCTSPHMLSKQCCTGNMVMVMWTHVSVCVTTCVTCDDGTAWQTAPCALELWQIKCAPSQAVLRLPMTKLSCKARS